MSGSLVERTRGLHETLERYQAEVVRLLKETPRTYRDTVDVNGVVAHLLKGTCDSAQRLAASYDDVDGARREEIASIGGAGPALYSAFYNRLREIKEYHKRFPTAMADDNVGPCDLDYTPNVQFTGEEAYGKCLDLHSHYTAFLNLGAQFPKKDYITYLDTFFQFEDRKLPHHTSPQYIAYLTNLMNYLIDFYRRAQPLFDIDSKITSINTEFEELWLAKKIARDFDYTALVDDKTATTTTTTETSSELRDSVAPPGTFFCDFCREKFSKETVFQHHQKSKRHLVKVAASTGKEVAITSGNPAQLKVVQQMEFCINNLAVSLTEVIRDTKDNVTKRQGRTLREIEDELDAAEVEEEEIPEDVEPEEEVKQTIDNYPVGWDGKPIPYWLYKLHGLGVEYKCEICGNTSYWGRRAYERHFQEWRHAHGMQCLGIPNTRHFHEITKINDALLLWEKIKRDKVKIEWRPDAEEEYEDVEGNVFNKKLYEDLVRQGVIQRS
ncbi:splicing factor SF3a60 [Pelomyxa schiedti]|nr:splicing factor SF3a60 [Pelomyxa schiedti]